MYQRRAIGHIARANEILARAENHSAEVELQFGGHDEDVITAKGFVDWIKKRKGEEMDIRDKFDEYMDAEDEKKRKHEAESREYTVLVRKDKKSNLYIVEDDKVMKDLRISKEVNDMIAKQKRTLLVISDKKAGLHYRDTNRRWLVLEYGSEKELAHAQQESQKDEGKSLCKTGSKTEFYYNDNNKHQEAQGAVLSLMVDSQLRKLLRDRVLI